MTPVRDENTSGTPPGLTVVLSSVMGDVTTDLILVTQCIIVAHDRQTVVEKMVGEIIFPGLVICHSCSL